MKKQMVKLAGNIGLLTVFALLFTQCEKAEQPAVTDGLGSSVVSDRDAAANPADVCSCLTANFSVQDLSDAEAEALLFMREEEKLARDVYNTLNEQWQSPVFANIERSEQRHMDAIFCLIQKYGLEDPVGDNGKGVFQHVALQELYQSLTAQGAQSLKDALIVGATIEGLDISDLMGHLEDAEIDNDDLQAVFNELARGSRNHLRAFVRQLGILGETYQVQYIDQETFDYIISTEREKGGAICGACPNGGPGNGGNGTGLCDGSGPHGNNGQHNGNGSGNGTGNCDGAGPNGNTGGNGNNNGGGNGNTGGNGGGNGRGN